MSIDAQIQRVSINENGGGELVLVDRPARPGGVPGTAGQSSLWFESAPEEVTALNGALIWGGSGSIILGDRKIADRSGYTKIDFVDRDQFLAAVAEYRGRA